MAEKDTYNVQELEKATGWEHWKIMEMIRKDQIKHIHAGNSTHHNVRIPKDEFDRLVKGSSAT